MAAPPIAGYTYGEVLEPSPVTPADLDALLQTLLWSDADVALLRRAGDILEPQVEAILDLWYGYVGSLPQLVATFAGPDGTPDADYLTRVRARFGQWVLDTCRRPYDADWLAYQNAIAQRHHFVGKNRTDAVASSSDHVPMRYLVSLIFPITHTIRGFLAEGASGEELDAMHAAWFKAVTLQAALWTQPYVERGW
jgi:hypothetical protein